VSCLCWCVEPHCFSHLLLDWQKDEYLCSFLEAVPRLVIHHLLQPVFLFLLRLVVRGGGGGGSGVGVGPFFFFLLKIVKIASLRTWFRVCQQPGFHRWLPRRVLFFSQPLHRGTYNGLLSLHSSVWLAQFRNLIQLRYECLLQWEQNRSKATMWQLYEFQLFGGAKKFLVDSRLCVACYHATTPTDYPSTTRGTSVGRPVAVDVDICGYLWFFIITFVWIMWIEYATDNLSGQQLEFAS